MHSQCQCSHGVACAAKVPGACSVESQSGSWIWHKVPRSAYRAGMQTENVENVVVWNIFFIGGLFFFPRQVLDLFWVPGSMLSCFSDFLLLCFSAYIASLLFCFLLFLLLCFSCFSAFLASPFPASLLFCFSVFPASPSLLLYFWSFPLLLFYLFFSSVMCFSCYTSCSVA